MDGTLHELKKHTTDIIEQRKQQEQKEAQIMRYLGSIAYKLTALAIGAIFTPLAFTFRKTQYNAQALIVLRMEDNKLYYGGAYFEKNIKKTPIYGRNTEKIYSGY